MTTHTTMKRALLTASSGVALALAGAHVALAQDGASEGRSVETIIVTAQQREQGVQDVPISIGAYDSEALQNAGVLDIKDLISIAPGLMVTSTQSEASTTARIRGIGTVGDNFGLESSVGVYIDGVFRARNGVGFGDLGEIERIEVLRGPQGTLFGKNTSAGVLNVITAQPEFEFGGRGELTFGNFGQQRYAGSVTGPLIEDTLAFRLYGVRGVRDGFQDLIVENGGEVSQTDSETQDFYSLRGQLLFTPTDSLSARLTADYTDRDEVCCSGPQFDFTDGAEAISNLVTQDADDFVPGTTTPFAGPRVLNPADPDERTAFANQVPIQLIEDWGVALDVNWDVGPGTLTSITAYRSWENERGQDVDYSLADLSFRLPENNFTDIERVSQEIRYAGIKGKLDYLVGGFFSREDLELGDGLRFGDDGDDLLALSFAPAGIPTADAALATIVGALGGDPTALPPDFAFPDGAGPIQDLYEQTATSLAVFTHNTYNFTDSFAITAGARFTYEEKDLEASFSTAPNGCTTLQATLGFDPAATLAGIGGQAAALAPLAGGLCILPYVSGALDATGYDQTRTDEEFSGVLKASYRFTDDLLVFGGYSRGFKAGGFNLDRILQGGTPVDTNGDGVAESLDGINTEFDPEFIDAFEIGAKTEWLNNSLLLNVNLFYQIISDFQLNTFDGSVFTVTSIDESLSRGVEIDALYLPPVDGLTIQGGFAYVNATYEDVNTGTLLFDVLEGENLSLSPEFFVNGAVTYERPLIRNLVGLASLDGRWVSEYNTGSDNDPEKEQEAFGLLNARVGVGRDDGLWQIEVFARNLTDETYAQVAFDAFAQGARAGNGTSVDPRGDAGYNAFLAAPRTWGVTLRTEF